MKDFTLFTHIAPSIEEIKSKYLICNDDTIKNYFKCDLLLKSEYTNTCIILRKNEDFYISGIHALNELKMLLTDYVLKVQTYPGELDKYEIAQEKAIYNAIRDYLIWQFTY